MKKLILAVCVLRFVGCVSEQDANRALKAQGFKNITITGYNLFACSKDDFYATGFCAENQNNERVCGTVCSGLFFKGSTIRY